MVKARGFLYGSIATPLNATANTNHTHRWKIYLKTVNSHTNTLIDKVEFKLHESFLNPKRILKSPPFEVEETGWGEFEIQITVYFLGSDKIVLKHMLQLYPIVVEGVENVNSQDQVVSEKYDEFVFQNDLDLISVPTNLSAENQEKEKLDLRRIEECHEKVLAAYEIQKLEVARLEEELKAMKNKG